MVMENEANRSLDLSEVLSRLNKQAVLVGGPHDGKRAPLPPVIYGDEHPRYLCQPGRPFDQTWYHYQLTSDTTYVYMDHCDTLSQWPHHPAEVAAERERERDAAGRMLFLVCAAIVLSCSALTVFGVLRYVLSIFL